MNMMRWMVMAACFTLLGAAACATSSPKKAVSKRSKTKSLHLPALPGVGLVGRSSPSRKLVGRSSPSPKSARACAAAAGCRLFGHCDLVGGKCAPSTDAHCAASKACPEEGNCGFYKAIGRCAPRNAADCMRSKACRDEGKCGVFLSEGECVAESDAHCQRSTYCKTRGYCRWKDDKCVRRASP